MGYDGERRGPCGCTLKIKNRRNCVVHTGRQTGPRSSSRCSLCSDTRVMHTSRVCTDDGGLVGKLRSTIRPVSDRKCGKTPAGGRGCVSGKCLPRACPTHDFNARPPPPLKSRLNLTDFPGDTILTSPGLRKAFTKVEKVRSSCTFEARHDSPGTTVICPCVLRYNRGSLHIYLESAY